MRGEEVNGLVNLHQNQYSNCTYLDTQLLVLEEGAGEMAFMNQGWNVQGNHAICLFCQEGRPLLTVLVVASINQSIICCIIFPPPCGPDALQSFQARVETPCCTTIQPRFSP